MTQSSLLYGQNETLHDRRRCMALVRGGGFAEVKRGGRGLSGSRLGRGLQRFQRVGVEEERHDAHEGDAVVIHPWFFVGIASDNDFSKGVASMTE